MICTILAFFFSCLLVVVIIFWSPVLCTVIRLSEKLMMASNGLVIKKSSVLLCRHVVFLADPVANVQLQEWKWKWSKYTQHISKVKSLSSLLKEVEFLDNCHVLVALNLSVCGCSWIIAYCAFFIFYLSISSTWWCRKLHLCFHEKHIVVNGDLVVWV